MEPEEPKTDEDAPTVNVEVNIPEPEPETEPEPVAPVVIVNEEPSTSDAEITELLDTRERLVLAELHNTELEERILEMETTAALSAAVTAETLAAVAELAEDVAEAEESQPVEKDELPVREHAFWRTN